MSFVLGPLLFVGCALLPFLLVERAWRWRWNEIAAGEAPAFTGAGGAYREEGTVPVHLGRAPRDLRIAAFTCLLLGQMFLPGLAMGIIGMLAMGIGIVSIPGLVVAAKLYGAGLALLRRQPVESYFKARDAARWALWLNGFISAGCALYLLFFAGHLHRMWPAFVLLLLYVAVSIGQALYLRAVVIRHEDALFQRSQSQNVEVSPGRVIAG
jgi:hypothetical protein